MALVRRRWGWVAFGLLLGWGVAIGYFFVAQAKYESRAQILVMCKDPRLATSGVQGTKESESEVSEDLLATHIQLVQSKRLVSQALTESKLDELPSIMERLKQGETPADYVIENLYVTRGGAGQSKAAHVLNIAIRHVSETETKGLTDALVKSYQTFLGDAFQDVNKEAAQLIEEAQKDLGAQLEQAESQYTEFRQRAPLLWKGEESSNIHRVRYEQIQTELGNLQLLGTEARSRLEVVEKGLKQYEEVNALDIERLALIDEKNATRLSILVSVDRGDAETAEFQALQPARFESAKTEFEALVTLMAKEKTLLQDFGPEHPDVRNTRQQIELLQDFLNNKTGTLGFEKDEFVLTPKKLMDAYVKLLNNDLTSLQRKEQELLSLATEEEEAAKALVSFELEGESLRNEVTRQQALYDAVVDRLREINLAKDAGGFINEVIAEPELGEKVWPNPIILLGLGTLCGLVLSAGGMAVSEFNDRSFRTPEDVRVALDLPLLSHVPDLTLPRDRKAAAEILESGSKVALVVQTYHRPKSREAEVFRGLRTSLFFSGNNGKKLKVIECTSPNQGDGKSTLAANLAVSIAQSGRKVLLVDCDMRRPRVHTLFGLNSDIGLAEVVTGDAEPLDAIQSCDVDNLSVLPCGTVPPNPAELLTAVAFENFLEFARERFEFVILDCPPVLAVADPCIVAPRVDGVVLALRVSKDSRPQTIRAQNS